jgi:hypothetical protein
VTAEQDTHTSNSGWRAGQRIRVKAPKGAHGIVTHDTIASSTRVPVRFDDGEDGWPRADLIEPEEAWDR